MARLLVQLKLRLLVNALRSSDSAKISFIISSAFAVLLAIFTFLVLAAFRGKSTSVELTSVIFTVFAFGWLIAPIMVFGVDSTLDPATLALYPLRTRGLAVGLLAASFTGFWPLANVIGLLGVTVGLASGAFGVIVAVVAVVLQVLFCIALSRFVTTSLASLLRSRRGRDLAAFMIIPLFALYEFFTQVVPKAVSEGKITAASFTGFDSWMRWLPPGLAAHAIQDASDGRPGLAFARLGALAAVIVVFVWLWVRSLGRALVTADTTTQSSRVRGTRLPLAGLGLRGTVAARFWLYQRREPLSLVYWALVAVITVAALRELGLRPHASSRGHPRKRGLRHRVRGDPPRQFGRADRTGVRPRGDGAGQQSRPACLLLRPEPRAVRHRGSAGRRGLLRAGRRGRRSPHGSRGDAGRPGRDRCRPGAERPFHRGAALPGGQAGRHSVLVPAPGYSGYRLGGLLTLAGTAVLAAPVIVGAVLAANGPDAIRIGVMLPCAAVYGFALAVIGVRMAAKIAERHAARNVPGQHCARRRYRHCVAQWAFCGPAPPLRRHTRTRTRRRTRRNS